MILLMQPIEHEYILAFAKNINSLEAFFETYSDEYIKRYKEQDEKGKFFWDTFKRKSGKQYYPITCPDGTVLQYDEDGNEISWLRSQKRFETDKKEGEIRFAQTTNGWSVQFKQRMPKGKKQEVFLPQILLSQMTKEQQVRVRKMFIAILKKKYSQIPSLQN